MLQRVEPAGASVDPPAEQARGDAQLFTALRHHLFVQTPMQNIGDDAVDQGRVVMHRLAGVLAVVLPSELLQFERKSSRSMVPPPLGEHLNFHLSRELTRRGGEAIRSI